VSLQSEALGVRLSDFLWEPSGRALFFEGASRGVRNLWKVAVEPETLRWVRGPERLTTGAGPDTGMALSADGKKLAFTTRAERTRLWVLPFDATTGKVKGEGQPATPSGLDVSSGDLTPDGKKLVFTMDRAGKQELRERSMEDGRETMLAADNFVRFDPCWSRDGTLLAYRRTDPGTGERSIVLMPAGGGEERVLTSPRRGLGAENASDWTPDGRWVLASTNRGTDRVEIRLVPVSAAPNAETQARVASAPGQQLWQPHLSPNGRWIAFIAIKRTDSSVSAIYVVPSSGGEWNHVTSGRHRDDKPRWSPDGRTIYFVSTRSGFYDVWGIRFDPVRGRPAGEPFRVTASGNPSQLGSVPIGDMEISLTADRLMLPITEATGNIWMLENVDR
jgi:Tol biopolymer transport system component